LQCIHFGYIFNSVKQTTRMNQFKELVKEWVDDDMSDTVLSIIETDAPAELKAQIFWFWQQHQDKMEEGWN